MLKIPTSRRVALLIDAENVQTTHLARILKIAQDCGNLEICRAYGDWKNPPLRRLLKSVQGSQIKIIQVDRVAKDTADKQLMIEAGEILGEGAVDIFVIATGDGDFRLLCERIKLKGRMVIGIGNSGKTSTWLQKSCNTFYTI